MIFPKASTMGALTVSSISNVSQNMCNFSKRMIWDLSSTILMANVVILFFHQLSLSSVLTLLSVRLVKFFNCCLFHSPIKAYRSLVRLSRRNIGQICYAL